MEKAYGGDICKFKTVMNPQTVERGETPIPYPSSKNNTNLHKSRPARETERNRGVELGGERKRGREGR